MQVTNVRDHVTHAVIGPQKAEEFEIANSAEFFHVLSSTLYSDKPLAVIREVLCNAWDAHIEAGLTDTAVKVSIDGQKLVIRDFGSGIARDKIKSIYCTYGASTKTANGEVTGGFGLGSKAPWAYVDHFQVTSFHEGEKTIYNASKSSAMVNGKPSLMPLVTVPTDESGLEVSLNLKDPADRHTFETIIERIVRFGEMKVELNGKELEVLPFEKAVHGFMILKDQHLTRTDRRIHVRYGNVVYPVESYDLFADQYEKAVGFLDQIDPGGHRPSWGRQYGYEQWSLVLQADPNTISVTPSRESLSMTEHTQNTVLELLKRFTDYTQGQSMQDVLADYTDQGISETWLNDRPSKLLLEEKFVNGRMLQRMEAPRVITEIKDAGLQYLKQGGYPKAEEFRLRDLTKRIDALIQSGFGNTRLLKSFRHHLVTGDDHYGCRTDYRTRWLHKKLFGPLMMGLSENKLLDHKRLHVYDKEASREWLEAKLLPVTKMSLPKLEQCLQYLRGVVIVAYTKMSVAERAPYFPVMKHWMGPIQGSLVYLVQRHPQKAEEALKFFEDRGFTVLDLTKAQKWEPKIIADPVSKISTEPAKPRLKGVPTLKSGLTDKGHVSIDKLFSDDATRVEKPAYVVQISSRRNNFPGLPGVGLYQSYEVAHLFGHMIGVAPTPQTEEKLLKAGSKSFEKDFIPWLMDGMLQEFQNNSIIEQWYRNQPYKAGDNWKDNTDLDYQEQQFFNYVMDHDEFRDLFKIPKIMLPDNIQRLIKLYSQFSHWERRRFDQLKKIDELVKTWTESPELKALLSKIKDNRLVECLNVTQITSLLSKASTAKPKEKKVAHQLLLTILKG